MKLTLISIAAAVLITLLVDLSIVLFKPTMYVEKAFNILAFTFIGAAIVTALLLRSRARKREANKL